MWSLYVNMNQSLESEEKKSKFKAESDFYKKKAVLHVWYFI